MLAPVRDRTLSMKRGLSARASFSRALLVATGLATIGACRSAATGDGNHVAAGGSDGTTNGIGGSGTGTTGTGGTPATGTGGAPATGMGGAPVTGVGGSGTGGAEGTGGVTGAGGLSGTGGADALPTRATIVTAMRLANDYFMAKWPDPGVTIVTASHAPATSGHAPYTTKA